MPIVTAVNRGYRETKAGTICVAPQLGWRAWLFPKHTIVHTGNTREHEVYHATIREAGAAKIVFADDESFFSQSDAKKFEIGDENLRKRFVDNLEKTEVEFKVTKVFHKVLSDFFRSEESRENDVAERVAKYYYGSHADPKVTAKMFCSQFVFQNLQNALVEQSCNGGLTAPIAGETFKTWRETHLEKIKEAVKKFPPELKHVSSTVTPNGLISILGKLAARNQESETDKKPASETGNIFSNTFRGLVNFFGGKASTEGGEKVAAVAKAPPPKSKVKASTTAKTLDTPSTSCRAFSAVKLWEKFTKMIGR